MIGKEIIRQNIHSPLWLLVIRRHLACKKGKEKQRTNSATIEISVFSSRSCPQNKQTNKNISNQNNTKKLNNSKGTIINSVKITDKIEQIRVKIWKELEEEEKAEIDTVLQTQKSKKFDFYFVHTIEILDDPYSRRISTQWGVFFCTLSRLSLPSMLRSHDPSPCMVMTF